MTARSRNALIGAATVGLGAFASWVWSGWGGPPATTIAMSVGSVASSIFATACAVAAGRRGRGPQRVAWLSLGVGLGGWVVGNSIRAYYLTATQDWPPFPSVADAFHLLLPLSACLAAVVASSTGGRSGTRVLIDGVVVTAAIFLISWTVFLDTLHEDGSPRGFAFFVSVAYPFTDLAMVTTIAVVLAKSRRGRRMSPGLLLAGATVIWATDSTYGYLVANPRDARESLVVAWAFAMYLIGVAALKSKPLTAIDDAPREAPSRAESWLPYLTVPFAFAFCTISLWPHSGTGPILVAGLILATALLLRQFNLLAENRRLLVTVADMALRDPLTNLSNRTLFIDRLAHAMQLRERTGAPVGVLLADLDDFKLVNDSLGHPVGDALLRSVGERIQNAIRPGDTVARLGGDEFAILVEDAPAIAEQIAESVVQAFHEPFVIDGRTVYMQLSIGLATAIGNADVSAEELFKRADLAMYSAKRAHVGARSFTPDMRRNATELNLPSQQTRTGRRGGVARIQFLADLRRAVDDRELDLVYQPKFNLKTRSAIGVEALIRWPHPEFGLLEPADFLPLVRENGLMEAVTDLVLERAVGDAAGWYHRGLVLPVAVNLSAPSLNDEALPERILSLLADYGMPANSLSVEITEDLLLASVVRARAVLDGLRNHGVRVAIDDFGSGYAAMTYLHELPVDELKLDRQFIAPILHDERAASIVRSVVQLANEFGLASVAEGVEDEATADLLTSYGCGFGQGHYFSPPVPAQAIMLGVGLTGPSAAGVRPSAATRPSWA
jgi:diguanylate cyclase (GGDEF)-like protein